MNIFVIGPFCSPHCICLNIVSDLTVLYESDAFSIFVLSTKKKVLQFFEKGSRYPENLLQSQMLKTSKISKDCHTNTCQSLKRRAILKIPSSIF